MKTLAPTGSKEAGGAQVLRIGTAGAPKGVRATSINAGSPAEEAAAIDAFNTKAAGQPSENVMIVSAADPQYAMPAAAWAAKSGDAVLYVDRDTIPAATQKAIREHQQPGIYVLGPEQVISKKVERALQKFGGVKRIKAQTPVEFAIAFARYTDGSFGWGVTDPGHGIVFANAGRTQDATAGAPLSGSGKYGPLLLLESPVGIPPPVDEYLLDIQPGYRFDPVRGVYNHAWLMGDESAISLATQAKIDSLLEIVPRPPPGQVLLSGAESPERLDPSHRVTVEDIRALVGPATPHFALQVRDRVRRLIDGLPEDDPVRIEGERAIARLEEMAREGQGSGPVQDHEQPLPSLKLHPRREAD